MHAFPPVKEPKRRFGSQWPIGKPPHLAAFPAHLLHYYGSQTLQARTNLQTSMAKIQVVDTKDDSRTPFLRGVLTRSLQEAGLSFEAAYALASDIRQGFGDQEEVTSDDLRNLVLGELEKGYGPTVCRAYEESRKKQQTVMVRDRDDQLTPFSRSRHCFCLESSGLSSEDASRATIRVFETLLEKRVEEVSSGYVGHLTYCCLRKTYGLEAAQRYLVWVDYLHSGRPLILLLGGATGCGKSTIATEIAHRLGIVRTQSTDMLREVMRMMVPKRLLPVLHESSFRAWQALPTQMQYEPDSQSAISDGYLGQMELLSLPSEAVIQRALRERVSLILEGVHVHPSLSDRIPEDERSDAIVVPVVIAVLKQKQLKKRLRGRGVQAPLREAEHQLSNFDAIWMLQEFLLSEADRYNVPVIANQDKDRAITMVLNTIIDTLSETFKETPRTVFLRDRPEPRHKAARGERHDNGNSP